MVDQVQVHKELRHVDQAAVAAVQGHHTCQLGLVEAALLLLSWQEPAGVAVLLLLSQLLRSIERRTWVLHCLHSYPAAMAKASTNDRLVLLHEWLYQFLQRDGLEPFQ